MNVVRDTRERLGWTQQQLAEDLRKSLRTITLWEGRETIDDIVIERAMERTMEIYGPQEEN